MHQVAAWHPVDLSRYKFTTQLAPGRVGKMLRSAHGRSRSAFRRRARERQEVLLGRGWRSCARQHNPL